MKKYLGITAALAASVAVSGCATNPYGYNNDPYANESWENACFEGNSKDTEHVRALGFKWFPGVVPPN